MDAINRNRPEFPSPPLACWLQFFMVIREENSIFMAASFSGELAIHHTSLCLYRCPTLDFTHCSKHVKKTDCICNPSSHDGQHTRGIFRNKQKQHYWYNLFFILPSTSFHFILGLRYTFCTMACWSAHAKYQSCYSGLLESNATHFPLELALFRRSIYKVW